ncbi:hypothetical protein GcC1_087028, partial [Golovinomyces cichoracearum]
NDIEALILDIDKLDITESSSETFYTSIDHVDSCQAQKPFRKLMDRLTHYFINHKIPKSAPEIGMTSESFLINNRYISKEWYGILIDTLPSTNSTAGVSQARAYMREFNRMTRDEVERVDFLGGENEHFRDQIEVP